MACSRARPCGGARLMHVPHRWSQWKACTHSSAPSSWSGRKKRCAVHGSRTGRTHGSTSWNGSTGENLAR
eukprot:1531770-Amphidinium_carterae.1